VCSIIALFTSMTTIFTFDYHWWIAFEIKAKLFKKKRFVRIKIFTRIWPWRWNSTVSSWWIYWRILIGIVIKVITGYIFSCNWFIIIWRETLSRSTSWSTWWWCLYFINRSTTIFIMISKMRTPYKLITIWTLICFIST
jgi:hypothetical protein